MSVPQEANNGVTRSGQDYISFSVSTWATEEGDRSVADPPAPQPAPDHGIFSCLSDSGRKLLVQTMFMSIFAILGALLRIVVAQLFGEECANPGTVGWLKAESALCVTADGDTGRLGGVVFADLPANLLGSFLMGMMQTTVALDLPGKSPIVWLRPDHTFQTWDILHLAIRTGFCGSLTTFSSWNSEMVIMLVGTGDASHISHLFRALFGYAIGMETALGSFVVGTKVAEWLHRWMNPLMAKEADALLEKRETGVYINTDLPDFERRFLSNLNMDWMGYVEDVERTQALERWRTSTEHVRRVGDPLLHAMLQVENNVLVERVAIPHRADGFARSQGWDVDALLQWSKGMPPMATKPVPNDHILFTPGYSTAIVAVVVVGLVVGLLTIQGVSAYAVTYRTMIYAVIVAPFGALLRWYFSGLNGKLSGNWSWFPAGTLAANLLGSVVSIATIGMEYILPIHGFWALATLRAVKIGFAGSLTTVSTFVAEVNSFMRKRLSNDKGYIYILMSLIPACVLSVSVYLIILVSARNAQN